MREYLEEKSGELGFEQAERVQNKIAQLMHCWENRFDPLRPEFIKRYLAGGLRFYVDLRFGMADADPAQYVAVFGGLNPGRRREDFALDWPICSDVGVGVRNHHAIDIYCRDADYERSMFVDIVKLGQESERAVLGRSSGIRLHRRDDVFCGVGDALYISQSVFFELGLFLEDRELGVTPWLRPVPLNERPKQVVQARSKLMRDFAAENRKFCGDRNDWANALKAILASLSVKLTDDSVRAEIGLTEIAGFRCELADVFAGPLNLCYASIERV